MIVRLGSVAGLRLGGAAAQLLLTFAVARLCGVAEAGIFFFGYGVALILSTFARLGSEISGLRAIAGGHEDAAAVLRARLVLTLGLSLLLALGQAFVTFSLAAPGIGRASAGPALVLLAAAGPSLAVLGLVGELMKGAGLTARAVILQNTAVPLGASGGLGLAAMAGWDDARAAALALALAALASAALALHLWSRARAGAPDAAGAPLWPVLRAILQEAPALTVVSSISILMQWLGAAILGFLSQPEAAAGFAVATRLSIVVAMLHSAVTSVLSPRLAAAHAAGDLARFRQLSHRTALAILAASLPALTLLAAFAPFFMALFDPGLAAEENILRLLIPGQLVAAAIGHSGTVLVMAGHYGAARTTSIIAAVALAMLMLALVPGLGAPGAALAMTGAVSAGHLAGLWLVRRRLGFWSLPTSPRAVALALGPDPAGEGRVA